MGQVTHEQANLLLRLYKLRRDPRMREAREWFIADFSAANTDELFKKYPPGSKDNASYRMVVSYWDMCAGMVNRGLIDEEFFFENNGEMWVVWDKVKELALSQRKAMNNPTILKHLLEVGERFEAWREITAPGFNANMRERFRQFAEARAKAART